MSPRRAWSLPSRSARSRPPRKYRGRARAIPDVKPCPLYSSLSFPGGLVVDAAREMLPNFAGLRQGRDIEHIRTERPESTCFDFLPCPVHDNCTREMREARCASQCSTTIEKSIESTPIPFGCSCPALAGCLNASQCYGRQR